MSNSTGNKIGNVMDGWHAIEYKEYVQVFDPNCAPYMRLYKRTTEAAAQKARYFIDLMNRIKSNTIKDTESTLKEYEKEIAILKDAREQQDKDSTKMQFDLAAEIAKLKDAVKKSHEEADSAKLKARKAEEQVYFLRNTVENQSVALRNISKSLEK